MQTIKTYWPPSGWQSSPLAFWSGAVVRIIGQLKLSNAVTQPDQPANLHRCDPDRPPVQVQPVTQPARW